MDSSKSWLFSVVLLKKLAIPLVKLFEVTCIQMKAIQQYFLAVLTAVHDISYCWLDISTIMF